MKKIKFFILLVMMLTCSSSIVLGSTKVPTKEWDLYDNLYNWSAYVNKNEMYSNYYFRADSLAFRIYGKRYYEGNKGYYVRMYNKVTGDSDKIYVASTEDGFDFYTGAFKDFNPGIFMYFSLDGSVTQSEVSLKGFFDTY